MTFLSVPIMPGERVKARVKVAELVEGTPVTLPVLTVGGTRGGGPTVYIQAGLHGDEQTAIEILRRVIEQLQPSDLRGNLIVVPIANVPAHLTRSRGFLTEERWLIDINRVFPGNADGLLTERIANVLFTEFISAADFTVDLHSALDGCNILPFSYVDPDDNETGSLAIRSKLAYAFGTDWVYHRQRGAKIGTSDMSRSLGAQADLAGRPAVLVEMGESRRVTESFVPLGVRGVLNVLKALEMLLGEPEVPAVQRPFTGVHLVHCSRGGGLRRQVDLGDEIRSGDVVGTIVDAFGEEVEELRAPVDGVVLRVMMLGAVNSGAEVVWIGTSPQDQAAANLPNGE